MQLKWARAIGNNWSAGVVLVRAGQDRSPNYLGSTLVVPVTWQASESVLVHLNAGRDLRHGQPDTSHAGVALEWAPQAAWAFVAERFREGGAKHLARRCPLDPDAVDECGPELRARPARQHARLVDARTDLGRRPLSLVSRPEFRLVLESWGLKVEPIADLAADGGDVVGAHGRAARRLGASIAFPARR